MAKRLTSKLMNFPVCLSLHGSKVITKWLSAKHAQECMLWDIGIPHDCSNLLVNVSFQELADLGVRRVSIGGSLARSVYYRIRQAAQEMFNQGTFSYADKQIPQDELNEIFEQEF